jgi:hypothetical protein
MSTAESKGTSSAAGLLTYTPIALDEEALPAAAERAEATKRGFKARTSTACQRR